MKRIKDTPKDVIEALTLYHISKNKGLNAEELHKYLIKKCNELGYFDDNKGVFQ